MTHELKILPQYFNDIITGHKRFELRKDDRGFAKGDTLRLRLYDQKEGYLGPVVRAEIDYILRDVPEYGLMEGYAILGIHKIRIEDWWRKT